MLDASALLAYLLEEPGMPVVREKMEEGGCVISAANWAEVLSKLAERGEDPDTATQRLAEAGILGAALSVCPLDAEQAVEIARLRPVTREAGLSLADRACLALATARDLPVLTADLAWAGLDLAPDVRLVR